MQCSLGRSTYNKLRVKKYLWWRDLEMVGNIDARPEDSFNNMLCYKLGEGKNIAFWKTKCTLVSIVV